MPTESDLVYREESERVDFRIAIRQTVVPIGFCNALPPSPTPLDHHLHREQSPRPAQNEDLQTSHTCFTHR